ncbi:hypothetical protein [Mucilaginibacter paludis]|uniref:Uncharacterized protein n=1 Tax=Mucilaginibacter paludis DSM 18603 TaxID=714943 RepID=H1Y1M2_9SPHI|nr:hypothetical protein [Mucilaginibacter paludis]EHQ24681.1 hypothetical protein Mucpa_0487 [Mucilaginibacter paludis DSM 18603]
MNTAYLNRVLIYLHQELPQQYREQIRLTDEKFIVTVPDTSNFQSVYELLHPTIVSCINRVRNRDMDLEFTIRSKNQERDFKILK